MINHVVTTSNLDRLQINERAMKLVAGMVDEFRFIFSFIKLDEVWLNSLCKIVEKRFVFCSFVPQL